MSIPARLLALVLALPLLASCALLADRREEVVVYSLRYAAAQEQQDAAAHRRWQLVLAEPQAIAPLDGTRIVVMPAPGEIQFYRGARWRDAVPPMLQALLLQAHERRVNASVPGNGMRADFTLRTTLRDFQAEYRNAGRTPIVVIGLAAQLIAAADGRVVANRQFALEQPAEGAGVAQVVAAFQEATDRLGAELAEWSLAAGDAAWNGPVRK